MHEGTSGRPETRNCPGLPVGADLAHLLTSSTPTGAPALAYHPHRAAFVHGPVPLPLTRQDWLRETLRALRVDGRPLVAPAVDHLANLLGGPTRADGLPGWHAQDARRRDARHHSWGWARGEPTAADHAHGEAEASEQRHEAEGVSTRVRSWVVTSSAAHMRGDRSLVRALYAAVACDLAGERIDDVSRTLGLSDHEEQCGGSPVPADPRGARRARSRGRSLLAHLGAWPWTHAADGQLPDGWRQDPAYVDPLLDWHKSAVAELRDEADRCATRFGGEAG